MNKSIEIYADIVLSLHGEDVSVSAHQNELTVNTSSIVSGLQVLSALNKDRALLPLAKTINNHLEQLGWTIYAKFGIFKLAILGLKGRIITLKLLLYFGNLTRPANGAQLK